MLHFAAHDRYEKLKRVYRRLMLENFLLVFSIGGNATLKPVEQTFPPVPMPTFELAVSKREIDEGSNLFAAFCSRCDGGDVGLVSDLRYTNAPCTKCFSRLF
jgi:hypothetical protein